MGKLTDLITGHRLDDTHDERLRQNVARFLITKKGYKKKDILPRCVVIAKADQKKAVVTVDFAVRLSKGFYMIVKYGPGSLVTRRRAALAASRLLCDRQVPMVVVTNGLDAEILNGRDGKCLKTGLKGIPSKTKLLKLVTKDDFAMISPARAEVEARVLYAFEVDGSCPCDDTICRI